MIVENVIIGGMQEHQAIKKDGVCTCLTSSMGTGGGYIPMVIEDKSIVAMRGRNPNNPSDRTPGAPTEQRLEPNSQGICNTLTSVQKDNLVLENVRIEKVGQISSEGSQCGTVVSENGLCPNLVAGTHGYANNHILQQYRIRKLTPLECWRLMGFTDEDFHKAEAVNSNTQLYKQAGNSIVATVLEAVFRQMRIQNLPTWNEEKGVWNDKTDK